MLYFSTGILAQTPQRSRSAACQLGLISIAGNKFEILNTGPSMFEGEYKSVKADWDLDDLVFSRVRAAAPGINVRRIAYDEAELRRAAASRSIFGSRTSDIRDFVRSVASGAPCDRYIVIHRRYAHVNGRSEPARGFGVVHVRSIWAQEGAYLYALTYIRIYDGHTFELIKEAAASIGEDANSPDAKRNKPAVYGPYRQIDLGSFPTTPEQASANPTFRSTIRLLLTTSLDRTLPAMFRSQSTEKSQ